MKIKMDIEDAIEQFDAVQGVIYHDSDGKLWRSHYTLANCWLVDCDELDADLNYTGNFYPVYTEGLKPYGYFNKQDVFIAL